MQATMTAAETAARIRKDLRQQWPAVKFAVRSGNHAGGSSVHISWIDGPVAGEVQRLVDRYGGASFDAMTDCKGYAQPVEDLPQSLSWLTCNRRYSRQALTSVTAKLCKDEGVPMPAIEDSLWGAYIAGGDVWLESCGRYLAQAVEHKIQAMPL